MLARRVVRYIVAGGLSTLAAYVATMLLLRVMNYVPATALAWVVSVGVGFPINRRFTFGIVGPEARGRDLGLFVVGAGMQLAITIGDYSITLAWLKLDPTLAFLINLVICTAAGFAFQNFVTFRRAHRVNPA